MTCYHPNKGFIIGKNPKTGKNLIKVVEFRVDHLVKSQTEGFWLDTESGELSERSYWHKAYNSICPYKSDCNKKICRYDCERFKEWFEKGSHDRIAVDWFNVPCGQCIGCRIDNSRQWAARMMCELEYTEGQSWFVTLTYDDEHLHYGNRGLPSLCAKDLTDFMKRLRRKYGNGIRFFACGEYGDKTYRPHYHLIIFNLNLDESKFIWQNAQRANIKGKEVWYRIARCPEIEERWQNGFVMVGSVNWSTCAYVSRYVTKKLTGIKKDDYALLDIEPVFARMSRKPGIGMSHFRDNWRKDYTTYIIRPVNCGEHLEFAPPKYFDYLMNKDTEGNDIEEAKEIVEKQLLLEKKKDYMRKKANDNIDMKLAETDRGYLEYLKHLEYLFEHSTNSLLRSDV